MRKAQGGQAREARQLQTADCQLGTRHERNIEQAPEQFDVMLESSKICWPSRGGMYCTAASVLKIVAKNGWFPWQAREYVDREGTATVRQDRDYSNLRLLSRGMRTAMDAPRCGGPDFKNIVAFLDCQNRFNDDERGFCDHCFTNEGDGCVTCAYDGFNYDFCECKESHRHGQVLLELDPRLDQHIEFGSLPLREQAKRLLNFLRQVASNFHTQYYEKWAEIRENDAGYWLDKETPDLTMIPTGMIYPDSNVFMAQFKQYNLEFYNFIHHLLFTGWADNDCGWPPGTISPYRGELIGDSSRDFNSRNGGHRE